MSVTVGTTTNTAAEQFLEISSSIMQPIALAAITAIQCVDVIHEVSKIKELQLPKNLQTTAGGLQFATAGIDIFCTIPDLVSNIKKAFSASTPVKQAKYTINTIFNGFDLVANAAGITKALELLEVISENAAAWATIAEKVVYPVFCITTAIYLYTMKKFTDFCIETKKIFDPLDEDTISFDNMEAACRHIENNTKEFYRQLSIGEQSEIDVIFRELRQKMTPQNSEEERIAAYTKSEELIQELKTRIQKKITINILRTALKITSLIVIGIIVFGSGSNPVTAGIALGVTVAIIGLYFIEKAFLPEDFLDKRSSHERFFVWLTEKKEQIEQVTNWISKKIQQLRSLPAVV